MATQDLTSPVAANQLAAGAFFSVKMATQDLTSPVAASQLAAGAFFSGENGHPGFHKPRHPNITGGGRDSGRLNLEIVSPQFHRRVKCIESLDINVYLPCGGWAGQHFGSMGWLWPA